MNRRTALKSMLALPAVASGQIPAERLIEARMTYFGQTPSCEVIIRAGCKPWVKTNPGMVEVARILREPWPE